MKKKFKFKKLMNEYRSLFYELKYIEEVLRDGNPDFEIYYRQYCEENDIDVAALNAKHATRVKEIFSNHKGITKAVEIKMRQGEFDSKNLFRQIARRFHPDTLASDDPRKEEYEEVFKKASGAIDECRWGELFDVADQYDLDLEDYDEINKSLKLDIQRIKKEIQLKKDSYAWLLGDCEEDINCKNNVVKRFLKHLFNI